MKYRFTQKSDYTHFASGRVFYSIPGIPAFPIRLMSEIFQYCLEVIERERGPKPVTIYDPCCGSAYHLATLAYLHGPRIGRIIGSDVDPEVLKIAGKNLGLLTPAGLDQRIEEIETALRRYGKDSHRSALTSALLLREMQPEQLARHGVETLLFCADILTPDPAGLAQQLTVPVDLIFADVPYGRSSTWKVAAGSDSLPLARLLSRLLAVVNERTVVAVAAAKGERCTHEAYRPLKRLKIGKREITILQAPATASGSIGE
jgi:hypothetical protein